MGWPMGRPVAASHSRAVLSRPPVRIVWPSGLKATAQISDPVLHRLAEQATRRDVPEPDSCRHAPAVSEGLAVGAERHGRHPAPVIQRPADGLADRGIPEPRRPVLHCR